MFVIIGWHFIPCYSVYQIFVMHTISNSNVILLLILIVYSVLFFIIVVIQVLFIIYYCSVIAFLLASDGSFISKDGMYSTQRIGELLSANNLNCHVHTKLEVVITDAVC